MNCKILLVDDDLTLLDCISQGLIDKGFQVLKADNGKDAINIAKTQQPDIILLDVVLPDLNGGEVAKKLENDPTTANIPIVFLTGLLTREEERTVINGRPFLGKPYGISEIITEIKRQTGKANG